MLDYAEPVTKLIDEFKRLPSIGQKSAQRLAFYILRTPEADVERLIEALPPGSAVFRATGAGHCHHPNEAAVVVREEYPRRWTEFFAKHLPVPG